MLEICLIFSLGLGDSHMRCGFEDLPQCRNVGRNLVAGIKATDGTTVAAAYTCGDEFPAGRDSGSMLIAPYAHFNGPMNQADRYGE